MSLARFRRSSRAATGKFETSPRPMGLAQRKGRFPARSGATTLPCTPSARELVLHGTPSATGRWPSGPAPASTTISGISARCSSMGDAASRRSISSTRSTTRTPFNPNGVVSTFTGLASPRNMSYQWNQPTDYQWNLTIDRQFPGNQSVAAGYVGARAIHIIQLQEGNPTTILGYVNGRPYYCHPADNPTGPPTLDDQCPTTAGFPPKSNPTYGIVNQNTAASDTWYNALQVKWTKRFSHGLSGGITYTWSKMLDYGSGQQGVEAAV